MILLTDGEIREAYGIRDEYGTKYGTMARVAKAQLKKVVDIIKEKQAYTAIVSETGNEIPFFNPIDWEEIWQALLKEIE